MNNSKASLSPLLLLIGGLLVVVGIGALFFVNKKSNQLIQSTPESAANAQAIEEHKSDDIITIENELVADFPDFPQYPKSTIKESTQASYGTKYRYYAEYASQDDVHVILNWYIVETQKLGWKVTSEPQNPQAGEDGIVVEKNGQVVDVLAEREENNKSTEIKINFAAH